jgi:hypothetical protein
MQPSEGRMAYDAVAEELSGDLTLKDLDTETVRLAQEHAKKSHKRWPPKPQTSGWMVSIWSM